MCGVAVNQAVFEFGVFVLVALGVQSCGGCDDGDDDFFGCLGGFGSTVSVVVTWGCVAVGGRCGASRWGDNGRLVGGIEGGDCPDQSAQEQHSEEHKGDD